MPPPTRCARDTSPRAIGLSVRAVAVARSIDRIVGDPDRELTEQIATVSTAMRQGSSPEAMPRASDER